MQATAHLAGTRDDAPATTEETRPVRILVPQERRDEYYLSPEDTLRASDLGITRHTSDTQIDAIMADTGAAQFVGYRDNLIRMRDALCHPRDVAEAVRWGFHVPNWLDPGDLAIADDLLERSAELGISGERPHHRAITENTTDERLAEMAGAAAVVLEDHGADEDPMVFLHRIRDARRTAAGWLPLHDVTLTKELLKRSAALGITGATAQDRAITENTTDERLAEMTGAAATVLRDHGSGEDPMVFLHRIRDARRTAMIENGQEISHDVKKRLGWWWVYDPERVETQAQRKDRYLSDERLIDMRGYAAVNLRQYTTIKDLKFEGDNARKMIENAAFRRGIARTYVDAGAFTTMAEAEAHLIAEAEPLVLKALPPREFRAGQSDLWRMRVAFADGHERTRLDEWYSFHPIKQTGRPTGSRTKNRRPKAAAE